MKHIKRKKNIFLKYLKLRVVFLIEPPIILEICVKKICKCSSIDKKGGKGEEREETGVRGYYVEGKREGNGGRMKRRIL